MIIFILIVIFCLMFSPPSSAIGIARGESAPAFQLKSIDGSTVSLDAYKGQIVVLIYWRPGHDPSRLALKEAYDELKKHEKKSIRILSVIADSENKEEARNILKKEGIDYPLLVDSERQLYGSYGIRVYPTTVIIDKQGIVAYDIPSHPPTFKNSLDAYIRKLSGEIDEKQLKAALSPEGEEKDKPTLEAQRMYNLALKFAQSRRPEQAIEAAKKAAAAKPDMAEPHTLLGFLYREAKENDKALASFTRALELDPQSRDAKTGLGGALLLKGDGDKAIEVLNSAALANPHPEATYYELGKAYELKGDKDKAVEMFRTAVEKTDARQILPSAGPTCQ